VSFAKRVMLILSAVAGASGWSFFAAFISCVSHTMHAGGCQSPRLPLACVKGEAPPPRQLVFLSV
jgi:hypothetical protein